MSNQISSSAGQLTNPSQMVIRNSEWLHCDRMLILGVPEDSLVRELLADGVTSEVYGFTKDFSVYRSVKELWTFHKQTLTFAASLPADVGLFDGVLIFLQKSKPLMDFWLDMIQPLLSEKATVWLAGENNEGIKSWRKRLNHHFGHVKNMDNARHCGLLEAAEPVAEAQAFAMDRYYSTYELPLFSEASISETSTHKKLLLKSLPGVFSHGRIDVGAKVLLDTFAQDGAAAGGISTIIPVGKVLDFGCGAGIVGGFLGILQPAATLTLVDCDAMAIASSRQTLALNGIQDYAVMASDGLSEVTGSYQLVVSNPPFHQGVKTHYAVTEQFLAESADLLVSGGELRIVANSFLRYEPVIKKAFGNCQTMVVKNGFTVYQAYKR